MINFMKIIGVSLVLSIPLMYLVDLISMGVDKPGVESYLTCFLSVITVIYGWIYLCNKADREELYKMRCDGLTDESIIAIIGAEKFKRIQKLGL